VSLRKDQIEDELSRIKQEMKVLSEKGSRVPDDSTSSLIRYLIEEREKTNRAIGNLMGKIVDIEKAMNEREVIAPEYVQGYEIPLSTLDANLLDFIKRSSMVCADDVKSFMNYKGRNAACSRLKKLEKDGFLEKFQLGHKVYYRYDAGKTTKTLIISPPQ
jgi:hypothetical protein